MGNMNAAQLKASIQHWQAELAKRDKDLAVTKHHEQWLDQKINVAHAKLILRRKELRALTVPPRLQIVKHALSYVGTKESPAGSNSGPHISGWEARFHMGRGPWCGAFAGAMIEEATGLNVPDGVVFTPNIRNFAINKIAPFHKWIDHAHLSQVRGGDLLLFDFPDSVPGIQHVGIARQAPKGGMVKTVEGNTSFGNGSQDNGGCVAMRERPLAFVVGAARCW